MTTAIPLEVAGLCEDCQHISANRKQCEKCGSKSMLPLAEVLNREIASVQQGLVVPIAGSRQEDGADVTVGAPSIRRLISQLDEVLQ